MLFNSHIFIFYFLPLTLLLYYCVPAHLFRLRNVVLLLASVCFYAWISPWFAVLMLTIGAIDYYLSLLMCVDRASKRRKLAWFAASTILNISLLGFFKYVPFFTENLNAVLNTLGGRAVPVLKIALPVGLSFYTFKLISYMVDVYRGQSPPARSIVDFICYVSFFPQILSGPIQRYGTIDRKSEEVPTFAQQLEGRSHTGGEFSTGIAMFILGFGKKILLANSVAAIADAVFAAQSPWALDAWFGALAYAFQLYLDFSAYSEMAIGLGLMLGFECPRNFSAPYLAVGITDFWRRWHISLSSWLRDYLYIPLGGSRASAFKTYLNLVIVFFICGLWHGANWTFIVWGTYHGLLLVLERALGRKTLYARLPKPLQVFATFVLITIGWVFFRSDNLPQAFDLLSAMLGAGGRHACSMLLAGQIYSEHHLIMMAFCAAAIFQPVQAFDWARDLRWWKIPLLLALFCLSIAVLFSQSFSSFLYFKF
jgi:alginate O-acetyltransferase complex protein AlgI